MTQIEENLLHKVNDLYATYSDEMSGAEIDSFNYHLEILLNGYEFTLEEYHDLLLEATQKMVEDGD